MLLTANTIHLLALLTTLLVEGAGMAVWARLAHRAWARATLCALLVNLVVHTIFWFSQPLFAQPWPWGLYGAEIIVILIEGAAYARWLNVRGLTPWLLSASLNLSSLLVGLWLWRWL